MSMILLFGIHLIYYNGTFGPVEVMPWPMNYSMEAHVHGDRFEGFLFSSHQHLMSMLIIVLPSAYLKHKRMK